MKMNGKVTAQEDEATATRISPQAGSPVAARLRSLEGADLAQLRAEWRRLVGTDPPRLSRDLLIRALAYRIQENAFGGPSRANLRRLDELARGPRKDDRGPQLGSPLCPGAKLVREWHGHTHVVIATEAGFDYAGSHYGSLTEIAKRITGAHWSGPRFFGLASRRPMREATHAQA